MKKVSRKSSRETHYSRGTIEKMRNTDYLEQSLAVGSTNRLHQYQRNLVKTRGWHEPNVDYDVLNLLKEFMWDKSLFNDLRHYLFSLKDKDGQEFSRNLKIYSTTEEAMLRFADKDHCSFRWNENYQKSLEELTKLFSSQQLVPLVYSSVDDVIDALPKKDTHSGYYWIKSGKKKKGDNIEEVFQELESRFESARNSQTFESPILIGFRTQASGEFEDDGTFTHSCKHKLRVVSMVDIVTILAELKYSKPLQRFLALLDLYAGGKDPNQISIIIGHWRSKYRKFMSIDYSSFDQTISSWLIEDAFKVLKSAFNTKKWTSYDELLWNAIVHDFIHKDFILGEGVLHSDKGVPSGSMFTQIIDSIVNLLVVKTYFNSINAKAEMITMGDDNLIYTSADTNIDNMASYIIKNFGLIVKTDDKSCEGRAYYDDPKFLSRYWTYHGQWRHPYQLFSRMVFPERVRNYASDIGPEHVVFAFILTYNKGMEKLIDVGRFLDRYPISKSFIWNNVDSRYLPGALAYIREYT